jgi:hypothetical protein
MRELYWELHWELYWGPGRRGAAARGVLKKNDESDVVRFAIVTYFISICFLDFYRVFLCRCFR